MSFLQLFQYCLTSGLGTIGDFSSEQLLADPFLGVYKITTVKQCGHPPSWLGGSLFKRGQLFVSHVNSSPHFVRKCPFYPWQFVSIEIGPLYRKGAAACVYIKACAYPHGYTQLHRNLASTELNNRQIAWENSRHFSPPLLVSLWNDVWEKWLQKFHTDEVPIPRSG